MDKTLFHRIENVLHKERLGPYGKDQASEPIILARYIQNMALCESLYPALQFAEVALRNAVHSAMLVREKSEAWYDLPSAKLIEWQQEQVCKAKEAIIKRKKPETAGRIVAELTFGFWTCFFNNAHARTGTGSYLAKAAFPHAPSSEQNLTKLGDRWGAIRELRNRVFHHERILHWRDLDEQYQAILTTLSFMSPELRKLAMTLDRFTALRAKGESQWIDSIKEHWPT